MKKTVPNRRKAPAALADFQRWFAAASSRPLLPGNATRAQGVDGPSLRREATKILRERNGMDGLARIEVYNRQYWFRLITVMQEEFPCCLHVIGLDAFNTWVIRYLDSNPPVSPYLADMDAGFVAFLRRRYRPGPKARGADRDKVLEAAAYDKAFSRAFDAPAFQDMRDPSKAKRAARSAAAPDAATKWILAPHVTPLWLSWDFAAYRALCREDEALTGCFPLRRAGRSGRGTCLHRQDQTLYEKAVSRPEFLLLDALAKPRTLDQVFRAALRAASPSDRAAMERNVGAWFRDWTELGWIIRPKGLMSSAPPSE